MRILPKLLGAVLLVALAGSAMAQMKDKPGGHDHEVVGRFAGSALINYGYQTYEEIEAPLGRVHWASGRWVADKALRAEGKLFHYVYWAPPHRGSLEVYRNYEQALKAKGFTILYGCDQPQQCWDQGLQHYAARWTMAPGIFGQSGLLFVMDDGNKRFPPRYLAASRESPQGNLYVTLTVQEPNVPQDQKGMGSPYYLQVLEAGKMKMDEVQVLDARGIGSELEKAGKVALYGIQFDTDSAAIRADSQPQLQQMAGVLKTQGQLKVFIVGHTDNAGSYEHNQVLSQRRAQAVVDALGSQGIDRARLQAVGVASVSPVASNANDAGRALNRRVEMVVQ